VALQTTGETVVNVERPFAFAFVQDAERLARCIPGCENLRELSPARYAAVLTSRVAFLTLRFNVIIDVLRIDPPNAIEAKITGDAIGLAGHVAAAARVQLVDEGTGRTTIRYATEIGLTGKLGGLGEPVFRATSTRLAREFGENLKRALEATRAETRA
jgi:carbon monoxide dehydrogenase subunit G